MFWPGVRTKEANNGAGLKLELVRRCWRRGQDYETERTPECVV